ncbi:MAG: hypothetical protein ACKOJC_00570, partial [Actinomycetota bacterium]
LGDQEFEARGDTVIVASEVEPDTGLADRFRAAGLPVSVVGDAQDVGYIEGAMHSAFEVARVV